jgi:hypothetical protein
MSFPVAAISHLTAGRSQIGMLNLRAAAFVTLLGGIWLSASPWVLGYATDHAAWLNELVTGTALVVLCASGAPAVAAKTVGSGS